MAFTCGFFNSVNHDRKYDAVQHGMIFDGIITDGIYATYLKAMVVKASSNPSEVIVQPGRAWFNHTWSYNDADYPIAAPEPEVVLDRIDTLVLDVNSEDAVRDCQFLWVQGTPTSQVPEPPELIHTVTHNQYPLCDVYRQAGTTQIYAADITNRVGTSDCPFVTGVLEGINIDDLLAQWDDEFHTWENATKASFEGWMLNQQAVYTAWWDALKTQMAGDVDDVEEWIQTIKDIIDEETATHLQLEIDEINSMLPAGSHITVTTTDTELYSRAVTITDEDDNTVTSQFDATGVAVFKSVPYVGNLTIEATDGIRTATAVVNTPYFARYEFPLAFWSATVNITSDTELGGETVTITDSSQILVGTVVLNASGAGVFNATYPDTYKFSVTHGGQTMEVSLAVTQETTYNVTIHAGFNWRGWVDSSKTLHSTDYNSLSEVLADEEAVRQLFLVHDCVDYLAEITSANADIQTIINTDLAAKWINLNDYALDTLYANTIIKGYMDTADKYDYGEWVITDNTTTPPTWAPKGNVPVMTSNTAPYGEAFADSNGEYSAGIYAAFNGDEVSSWLSNHQVSGGNSATGFIGYKSTNPICVKKILLNSVAPTQYINDSIQLYGSNDGSTYEAIGEAISNPGWGYFDFDDNDKYYLYHKVSITQHFYTSTNAMLPAVTTLQFYGRELSVSVPTMTGNTTPYGEVTVDSTYSASGITSYGMFTDASYWESASGSTNNHWNQYKFPSKMLLKRVYLYENPASSYRVTQIATLSASNTGNQDDWHVLANNISVDSNGYINYDVIDNNEEYQYYKVNYISNGAYAVVSKLQFYGLDYSEKEFEEGTTKKWLYDHGVELETITISGTGTKGTDAIQLTAANAQAVATIDTTDYSLMRGKVGSHASGTNQLICGSGASNFTVNNMPYNNGFDVSSVNGSNAVGVKQTANGIFDVTEFWLE